ncbi:MAG: ABC transporter permease subunit [Pseudomonadales bacterium]|nr:ABC transporter permease subunit [Pseudomonadales bacterium]
MGTFVGIITLIFVLLRLIPGGPFDGERALPPEVEANLRSAYHLDEPLPAQYLRYLGRLVHGDLGPSFRQKDFSVNELVGAGLPVSLGVGGAALCLALLLGITAGTGAAMKPGSLLDTTLMALSGLGLAVPAIVLAPLAVLVFAVLLHWLPAGGIGSPRHYVLPAFAAALPYAAAVARLWRGAVLETLTEPHLLTARAKGVGRVRLYLRHVFPLAAVPLVSWLGPMAAGLLTGTVVVEQVFDLPGIGRYFVQAAINRDYTLVMGVAIVYAALILSFNFLTDLVYGWLDPRLKVHA